MSPKVEKIKPDKEALKKPVELPDCEVKEGEVWYPPDEFLVYAPEDNQVYKRGKEIFN
jgi:hypothetical protein